MHWKYIRITQLCSGLVVSGALITSILHAGPPRYRDAPIGAPSEVVNSTTGHVPETGDGDGANTILQVDQSLQDVIGRERPKVTADTAVSDTAFN